MQSKIKIFRFNNKIEDYANKKLGYSELYEIRLGGWTTKLIKSKTYR
ncbi:MAG: hypothetical protein U9O96_07840 [Candidatus Thermoplasmatota archaeon]|nr:hypothetical protein [Candidatus Thermoplasmatota archaeon]